jgi:hypothetical protein
MSENIQFLIHLIHRQRTMGKETEKIEFCGSENYTGSHKSLSHLVDRFTGMGCTHTILLKVSTRNVDSKKILISPVVSASNSATHNLLDQ